jgi:flagellar M-ring protein FliF
MDAQRLKSRAQGFFGAFTPQQIVIVGVLGVLALVAMIWFMSWISKPSYTTLTAGLTPEQARTVTDALTEQQIAYRLGDGGTSVQVKAADVGQARLAVGNSNGGAGGVVGFEIFDKSSFTQSDLQQQVALQRAIQGELTRSIMAMDGVTSATVHLAVPTQRLFQRDQKPTQAAIMVASRNTLSESQVEAIVRLVSSSVPGLEPSNVAVTDTKGRVLTQGGTSSSAAGDRQLAQTQAYELALAARAESMLAEVFGPGKVLVRVTADMNFNQEEKVTTQYLDDPKAVKESQTIENFTGAGNPPGGVIGVEGQVAGNGEATNNQYERSETGRESVVSSEVTRAITAPGTVRRLSVAAIIDEGIANAPDVGDVEQLVRAAVGIDDARNDVVAVQAVAFDEEQQQALEAAREAAEAAAGAGAPMPIFDYVRMGLGGVMLVLVALFLRRGLRTQVDTIDLDQARVLALDSGDARAIGAGNDRIDLSNGTSQVPMELRLIDQDPDQVATLLRSWIADRRR